MKVRKILEVHVDKGMKDGQKIVFSGEGDHEPDLEPGDIVIVLYEKEHTVSTLIEIFYQVKTWSDEKFISLIFFTYLIYFLVVQT